MTRSLALLGGLLGLVLVTGLAVVAINRPLDKSQVHTVAQLQAHLARNPGAWVGRTVWVRGRATACSIRLEHGHFYCIPQPRLGDPDAGATTDPLPLVVGSGSPLLAALRRLPLVSQVVPAPQWIEWGALATYRVRLRAAPTRVCGTTPCYEAVLLDTAPDSLPTR